MFIHQFIDLVYLLIVGYFLFVYRVDESCVLQLMAPAAGKVIIKKTLTKSRM